MNSYYRAENILPVKSLEALKSYVFSVEDGFQPAKVTPVVPGFRVASVLFFPVIPTDVKLLIQKHVELASIALSVTLSGKVETQITRTPNGGYFKRHIDNTIDNWRTLSYVFYFGESIKSGELSIDVPGSSIQIAPCCNSIVVFRSSVHHEVLPVVCGDAFTEGRFTVNGWVGGL